MPTITLQQGLNGYTGTQDTRYNSVSRTTNYGSETTVKIDRQAENGGRVDGLLRFDNVSALIPDGAVVTSAVLTLNTTDAGAGATFYQLTKSWSEASTYDSLGAGITVGTETVADPVFAMGFANTGPVNINVVDSVQAWADGAANYGWFIKSSSTSNDGWQFSSSEGTIKPKLTITYETGGVVTPPPPPPPDPDPATPFTGVVRPAVETAAMVGTSDGGDVADDPAIWYDQINPSRSVIIGTNKDPNEGGLYVFGLDGGVVSRVKTGYTYNNVDLRHDFMLGGQPVVLVGASNRELDRIDFYKFDSASRTLTPVGNIPSVWNDPYGFTMSEYNGVYSAYVSSTSGDVKQYTLNGSSGTVTGTLARTIDVGTAIVEGMVVDDQTGALYVAQETGSIWKYGPTGTARVEVDNINSTQLNPDIEGLAIYYATGGAGYLIASSQGSSSFAVYDREGSNDYLGSFTVGSTSAIDATTGTDGIDVINVGLGSAFPKGALVVHDHTNTGGPTSNFKIVDWGQIANLGGLTVDTTAHSWMF